MCLQRVDIVFAHRYKAWCRVGSSAFAHHDAGQAAARAGWSRRGWEVQWRATDGLVRCHGALAGDGGCRRVMQGMAGAAGDGELC